MRYRNLALIFLLAVLLAASGKIAGVIIDYNWWREVGQLDTWFSMLLYQVAPAAAGTLIAFIALWLAHARGLQFAGVRRYDLGLYRRAAPVGLALMALLFATASIDYWAVMSYAGSRGIVLPPDAWKDQVFHRSLPFYLFDLPFYSELLVSCSRSPFSPLSCSGRRRGAGRWPKSSGAGGAADVRGRRLTWRRTSSCCRALRARVSPG